MDPRELALLQATVKAMEGLEQSLNIISKRLEKFDINLNGNIEKLTEVMKKAVEPPNLGD